jgi:subfamily B ATP-binding cassette protein MsbA
MMKFAFWSSDTQNAQHMRRLLSYAKPYQRFLVGGLLCMLLVAAASAASAKLMKPIINDVFLDQNQDMLWMITFGVFLVFLVKGVFTYGESYFLSFVGNRITADIQRDMFNHVIYGDLKLFHTVQSGDLVSRFMNDVTKLNNAVTGTFSNIGKDFFTLLFFLVIMLQEDPQLFVIVFVVLPVAILPVVKIGRYMRKTARKLQEQTAELTVLLTQAFQGIRLIKAYNLEQYEQAKMSQAIEDVFTRLVKGVRMKSASHPIMEFLGGIAIGTVICYGGHQVIEGAQTPGAFFTFITALIMSYEPLKRLANLNANLQEQMGAADRVFALMDRENEVQDMPRAHAREVFQGQVTFENVGFYYYPGQPVLSDISLTIKAGDKIAFVGPSGGGKSTLFNLLLRFFDPTIGRILIDGIPLMDFTMESLRHQIAFVSQDVVLFDDTIAANIAFGKPGASQEDIKAAARAAAAHDFIMALPQGYDTPVGEQGLRLSGGQRQRISIARAMLKDAPILLLDEPTSALDSESEHAIQEALGTLMKGRTTLVIAHRLVTVQDADVIYLLESGRLTAHGRHQALMKQSAKYAQLCQMQLLGEAS